VLEKHPIWLYLSSGRKQLRRVSLHSFVHSRYFYSASSSPLILRVTPDYSIDTVSELTHRSSTGNCERRTCQRWLRGSWSGIQKCDHPDARHRTYHWTTTPSLDEVLHKSVITITYCTKIKHTCTCDTETHSLHNSHRRQGLQEPRHCNEGTAAFQPKPADCHRSQHTQSSNYRQQSAEEILFSPLSAQQITPPSLPCAKVHVWK